MDRVRCVKKSLWRSGGRGGVGGGLAWVNVGAFWKREEWREVRQDCGT
jgi:hypothetical protein